MTVAHRPRVFLCNGASLPPSHDASAHVLPLDYRRDARPRLVTLNLPNFVDQLYHLPPRILDLLEIAAYVFAGDRAAYRGAHDAVEYHAWARSMHFVVRVRDVHFWQQRRVSDKLSAALCFMTGDLKYTFDFQPGHNTPPTSLFDREDFIVSARAPASVALFSGGLDSLTGVLQRLQSTDDDVYLISHRSGQPSTKRTQARLAQALITAFPGRVRHYSFDCGLASRRGAEETQRTRAFLFNSVAFAVSHRLGLDTLFAYENGVTSLNFHRRQDLSNARASRTTHPQTHTLMADFLSELHGRSLTISNPFWTNTKADVFGILSSTDTGRNLITSSVSCSKTFQRLPANASHCGACFQCVDRRLAAYAAGVHDVDDTGIYSSDVFRQKIETQEARTTAVDYVRQAREFACTTEDAFAAERLAELSDVTQHVGLDEDAAVNAIWSLCHRHGNQVMHGLNEVRRRFDDLRYPLAEGSLLQLISSRAHLSGTDSPPPPDTSVVLATIQSEIAGLKQTVAAHPRFPGPKPRVTFSNGFKTVNCTSWTQSESRARAREQVNILRALYQNYQTNKNRWLPLGKLLKGGSADRLDKALDSGKYPQTYQLLDVRTDNKTGLRFVRLSDAYEYESV